jgi:hypothetical protein
MRVVQFFVANPMLDPHQVGPIVDWIHNQRFVGEPRRIVNGIAHGGGGAGGNGGNIVLTVPARSPLVISVPPVARAAAA